MTSHRLAALAVLVGLSAAGIVGLATHSPHGAGFLPDDTPAARHTRELTAQFGLERPVVWIVEGRAGTIWSPAVLARIQALTREAFAIPGVMAPDVLSLASPNVRDVRVTDGGLTPVYLMGTVPEDAAAVAALRRRVDEDPMLRGNLASLDGRAALVVANFHADADAARIGTAALALRDRFRDDVAQTWVVGAPVLALTAPASARRLVLGIGGALLVVLGLVAATLGARHASAVVVAGLTAALATSGAAALLQATLPWTALAGVGGAALAVALASRRRLAPGHHVLTLAGTTAFVTGVCAVCAGAPLRAFLGATAAGVVFASVAALAALDAVAVSPRPPGSLWPRHAVAVVLLAAMLGALRLGLALDDFGYGLRYLPSPARDDLAALARHFPPPTSLAVRVRGAPGFVKEPAVLHALDRVTATMRDDAAVASATSLADLVKRVHRAFNDDDPAFERLPDDAIMVGRYLALAYSPGFRRFVDRPLATTAVWVSLREPDVRAVARTHATLIQSLAATPVPNATVDPPSGDAMALLAAARVATILGWAVLVVPVAAALLAVPLAGAARAARALLASVSSLAAGAGLLGWAGMALDLAALPVLFTVALAAFLAGAASDHVTRTPTATHRPRASMPAPR